MSYTTETSSRPAAGDDHPLLRILTVGDGDMTLSLAIARAYGNNVQVTVSASTLEHSKQDLLRAYPNSNAGLLELLESGVPVLYGVDATQLHCCESLSTKNKQHQQQEEQQQEKRNKWDVILFHHPHLGLSLLKEQDEEQHARRHHVLLSHYLHSACRVLAENLDFDPITNSNDDDNNTHGHGRRRPSEGGLVHVCLCGTQAETWRLLEAAQRQGLRLLRKMPTTTPFHHIWYPPSKEGEELRVVEDDGSNRNKDKAALWDVFPSHPGFAAPRRYRNGKLGSRHFLGKYGYRHRRTEGQEYQGKSTDMNVSGSMHYVFCRDESMKANHGEGPKATTFIAETQPTSSSPPTPTQYKCTVCDLSFDTLDALHQHSVAPALPEKVDTTTSTIVATASDEILRNDEVESEKAMSIDDTTMNKNSSSATNIKTEAFDKQGQKQQREEASFVVTPDHNGKRLRWLLRQFVRTLTKRTTNDVIQAGRVLINGKPALDSSRILLTGDSVIFLAAFDENNDEKEESLPTTVTTTTVPTMATVHIVQRVPSHSIIIAWKTAGIRTRGMFVGGGGRDTLEYMISKQEGSTYTSLTQMDTGCLGLCALSKSQERDTKCHIQHVMTVLVHGTVPDSWCTTSPFLQIRVPIQAQWKKKKRKRDQSQHNQESTGCVGDTDVQVGGKEVNVEGDDRGGGGEEEVVELHCTERTSNIAGELELSTLTIRMSTPSASSICLYLRKHGYPVVGDRFCRREYLCLKRSIRNRLKDKLCVGCFQIELSVPQLLPQVEEGGELVVISKKDIPDKFSALYWQSHMVSSLTTTAAIPTSTTTIPTSDSSSIVDHAASTTTACDKNNTCLAMDATN